MSGAAEDAAADMGLPELLPVGLAVRVQGAVEAADEDAVVADRRRRVAPARTGRAVHSTCPLRASSATIVPERADRVEPAAVGRGARVEALVAERVALHVRDPEPRAVLRPQAEDRAGIRRDAHAPVGERRARVDPAAGVVDPADLAGLGPDREEAPVGRAEVGDPLDDRRRRLDLRVRAQLPDEPARSGGSAPLTVPSFALTIRSGAADRGRRRLRRRAVRAARAPCRSSP